MSLIKWKKDMIDLTKIAGICAGAILMAACGSCSGEKKLAKIGDMDVVTFDDMDVIGSREGEMAVADLASAGAPKAMLLSDLADDVELVRLDPSDEAIVKSGDMWMSDKRFVIFDGNELKQFDRSGKYLGKIGSKGNGPGEYYIAPYNITIDEAGGRIYMLTYAAKKILTYDLEGNFIGDLPLARPAEKGFMEVNPDSTLTVAALTFTINEDPYAVWRQDFQGNLIEGVQAGHLAMAPDYSNEIHKGLSDDGFTYSLFRMPPKDVSREDTLYVYTQGALRPDFTARFDGETPLHRYGSFPGFYLVDVAGEPVQVTPSSFYFSTPTPVLIDRQTLRGGRVEIVLDLLGPIFADHDWVYGKTPGYFTLNLDPGDLEESLRKALAEQTDLSDSDRERINGLLETISPDDNNYLIVGKWKK